MLLRVVLVGGTDAEVPYEVVELTKDDKYVVSFDCGLVEVLGIPETADELTVLAPRLVCLVALESHVDDDVLVGELENTGPENKEQAAAFAICLASSSPAERPRGKEQSGEKAMFQATRI